MAEFGCGTEGSFRRRGCVYLLLKIAPSFHSYKFVVLFNSLSDKMPSSTSEEITFFVNGRKVCQFVVNERFMCHFETSSFTKLFAAHKSYQTSELYLVALYIFLFLCRL